MIDNILRIDWSYSWIQVILLVFSEMSITHFCIFQYFWVHVFLLFLSANCFLLFSYFYEEKHTYNSWFYTVSQITWSIIECIVLFANLNILNVKYFAVFCCLFLLLFPQIIHFCVYFKLHVCILVTFRTWRLINQNVWM